MRFSITQFCFFNGGSEEKFSFKFPIRFPFACSLLGLPQLTDDGLRHPGKLPELGNVLTDDPLLRKRLCLLL
jgi:hypothetical protein